MARTKLGAWQLKVPFGCRGNFTPPVSDFTTWVNQGTRGSMDTSNGLVYLEDLGAATGSENVIGRVKSAPATPWTMTLAYTLNTGIASNVNGGIMIRDSGTGRIKGFATRIVNATGANDTKLNVFSWSNASTFNTTHLSGDWALRRDVVMLRIRNDGTNLIYECSQDFVHWVGCLSETLAGNYIASVNQVGFYINSLTTGISNTAKAGLIVHHAVVG